MLCLSVSTLGLAEVLISTRALDLKFTLPVDFTQARALIGDSLAEQLRIDIVRAPVGRSGGFGSLPTINKTNAATREEASGSDRKWLDTFVLPNRVAPHAL